MGVLVMSFSRMEHSSSRTTGNGGRAFGLTLQHWVHSWAMGVGTGGCTSNGGRACLKTFLKKMVASLIP